MKPVQKTIGTLSKVADRLNHRHRAQVGADLPPLLMLTDERRLPDPLAVLHRLPPGSGVILRHYGLAPWERRSLAHVLRRKTRERRLLLLIAGDAGLARETGADGVHWPERATEAFRDGRRRPGLLTTAAAHSPAAMIRAARAGADAVLISPVFPTASHPGAPAIGIWRSAAWLAGAPVPAYALGGITGRTAPRLLHLPFAGLAAVGAFD